MDTALRSKAKEAYRNHATQGPHAIHELHGLSHAQLAQLKPNYEDLLARFLASAPSL